MIDLIREFYRSKVNHYRAINESLHALQETSNIVTERSMDGGWSKTNLDRYKGNSTGDQASMLSQARHFWRNDPHGRAILLNLVTYIVGEGVKVTPQSEDPRIHKLWREFWGSPRNGVGGMKLKIYELVLRTLRDGESFLHYFNRDASGSPTWKTSVRFRDPGLLYPKNQDPNDSQNDGVVLDPGDPERAVSYTFRRRYNSNDTDTFTPKEVQHIKAFADSDQKRGESLLQPDMELFQLYKDWLNYRIVLNKVRTSIVLIKKITGGSADVQSIKGTLQQSPTARTGEAKKRIPPPGTIINANQGVDYEFKNPNINASDAAEDGRNLKIAMAAGAQVPEYVLGDASNSNFASTMVSEAPFVKHIRYWQLFFECHIQEMFRRVIQAAVDAEKLTPPPEEDIFTVQQVQEAEVVGKEPPEPEDDGLTKISEAEAFFGCDVQWPEVVHREIDKTTNAVLAQRDAGLISDSTAASILGYDYDEECRKQEVIDEGADENPFKKSQAQDAEDQKAAMERAAEVAAAGQVAPGGE